MVHFQLAGLGITISGIGIGRFLASERTILRFRNDDNEASDSAIRFNRLWGIGLVLLGLFTVYLSLQA